MTIQEFAERKKLILKVKERDLPAGDSAKFAAKFEYCDIKEGNLLMPECGNGATEGEAIRNYAAKISGAVLVYKAWQDDRRVIVVPELASR